MNDWVNNDQYCQLLPIKCNADFNGTCKNNQLMIYIHTSTINNRKNRFYCYKLNVFTLFCTKDEKTSTKNEWPSDNVRIESYFVETYFTVNVKLKWPHYYAIITVVIVVVTIIIYYLLNNRRDFLIYHRQRHYLLNGTAIFLSSFNLVFKRKPFCHLNYHTQYLNIIHLFGSIYYIEPIKTTNDNDDVHEGTMEWMLPLLKCKLICWNRNFIRNRMSPLCRSVAAEPDNNEYCDCGVVNMEYKIPLFTSNYKLCDPLRTKSANSSMLIKCLLALLLEISKHYSNSFELGLFVINAELSNNVCQIVDC
ncbi:hypothetical protein BLOT_006375 [Blomia tropicalis]|nr:hypothetical protein BLOT_006375 [Blomia tropicalis]